MRFEMSSVDIKRYGSTGYYGNSLTITTLVCISMNFTAAMSCPDPIFSNKARITVGCETLLLCGFSFFLQLVMVKVTHKFSGWQSNYSYALLRMICIIGTIFYATEFVGHVRFITAASTATIDRFFGATFLSCFLVETLTGISLVAHRVIYTVIPFKAEHILSPTLLKFHLLSLAVFFITLTALMCTPYAGVIYCVETLKRKYNLTPGSRVIFWMNTVCNYFVGLSTITAYTIVTSVLFIRGNITFRSNAELRMMIQVAAMSTIGVFYFIYWETRQFYNLGQLATTILYENLSLFYYDAVMLPYLLLNNTFRNEFMNTFRKKRNATNVLRIAGTNMDITGRKDYQLKSIPHQRRSSENLA